MPALVGELAAASKLIPCDRTDSTITIKESSHLDPSCVYDREFEITGSNVVFDCRGATIATERTDGRGIAIKARGDTALHDITVRNCVIRGFLNSLRVTRTNFKELAEGEEYLHTTSNILVENSRMFGSRGSGIFVDGYVADVTLRDLEIAGAGSVGIYLEAGSRDNVVQRCEIHDNGYNDTDPAGTEFSVLGGTFLYVATGREGIAVDGSRNNRIVRNRIYGNAAGGIFLYKNCGEERTTRPNGWWKRRYGADGNRIVNNEIRDEPTGIWVGSRMAENQLLMDCGDPAYGSAGTVRYHLDYARGNHLWRNRLFDVRYGIRIEDDDTWVIRNRFVGSDAGQQAILVGTKVRTELLGEPVTGASIAFNQADIAGNDQPYRWIHGQRNTRFRGNRSGRYPVDLIQGTQPPISPFLFVERFWVAGQ